MARLRGVATAAGADRLGGALHRRPRPQTLLAEARGAAAAAARRAAGDLDRAAAGELAAESWARRRHRQARPRRLRAYQRRAAALGAGCRGPLPAVRALSHG